MSLEKKAKAAQLSVLSKYGVLADFSALEDAALDRALKGGVGKAIAQDLTFASWCDQLLGPGERLPVARFDGPVAGQTKLTKLAAGHDLVQSLKTRERQLQTSLKAAQSEIARLRSEVQAFQKTRAGSGVIDPISDIAQQLRSWYHRITPPLHRVVWDINEVEGAIFENQGPLNRDYRKQLVEIILNGLADLEYCGFSIDVELRSASSKEPIAPSVVLHRSRSCDSDEYGLGAFEFVVEGVQPDALNTISEPLWQERESQSINENIRYNCHVKVAHHQRLDIDEAEIFHLSCFMHKLFEAMARSSDRRSRGTLREHVILCLLLSCTAPCMPAATGRQDLPQLQDTFYGGHTPPARRDGGPNASAGKVVEHLFQILHAQTRR
ncbi:MAG: hypothetical protein ACOH2T_18690 [Pseudomonas sp.]